MATVETKPITERDPGPYPKDRRCPACKCFLSRVNPGPYCQPCYGVTVDPQDPGQLLQFIASMKDSRRRREAFEALALMQEATP